MQSRTIATCLVLLTLGLFPMNAAKGQPPEPGKETKKAMAKPVRVLLMAGGPGREYQFVRNLLLREAAEKRAELCIYLQSALGDDIEQGLPAERLLRRFPSYLEPTEGPGEKRFDSLADFDVVIAMDADWTLATPAQLMQLRLWVHRHGGGLIFVAGPVHTFHLARAGAHNLRDLLSILPVKLKDYRLFHFGVDHDPARCCALNFVKGGGELDCLKLQDGSLDAWDKFFWGDKNVQKKTPAPVRGFHSYYPVDALQPEARVAATMVTSSGGASTDKRAEQPFLVTRAYGSGSTVYLASAEMWRLRCYRAAFHEHFWTRLIRDAAAGRGSDLPPRALLFAGEEATVGDFVTVQARLIGPDRKPIPSNTRASVKIEAPAGARFVQDGVDLAPITIDQKWSGWFQGRFKVLHEGDYQLRLSVPGEKEPLTARVVVRKTGPRAGAAAHPRGDPARQFAEWQVKMTNLARQWDKSASPEIRAGAKQAWSALELSRQDNLGGQLAKLADGLNKRPPGLGTLEAHLRQSREADAALAKLAAELERSKEGSPKPQDFIAEAGPMCERVESLAERAEVVGQQLGRVKELLARIEDSLEKKGDMALVLARLEDVAAELRKTASHAEHLRADSTTQDKDKSGKALAPEQKQLAAELEKSLAPLPKQVTQVLQTSSTLIEQANAGKGDVAKVRAVRKTIETLSDSLHSLEENLRFLKAATQARLDLAEIRLEQQVQIESLGAQRKKLEADLLKELLK